MTSTVMLLRHRPPVAAIGGDGALATRTRILRIASVLVLGILLLGVRTVLKSDNESALPPLVGAARVSPGLLRGGQPDDFALDSLAEQYRVGGVVNLNSPDIEEQAVTGALNLGYLQLPLAIGASPTWPQLLTIVRFIRAHSEGGRVVYLHDDIGGGRAVATSEMLLLVRGDPLSQVVADAGRGETSLSEAQRLEVRRMAASLDTAPGAAGSDEAVSDQSPHHVDW